jgi:hypothetical protein
VSLTTPRLKKTAYEKLHRASAQVLATTATNHRFPYKARVSERLLASQDRFCSTELVKMCMLFTGVYKNDFKTWIF